MGYNYNYYYYHSSIPYGAHRNPKLLAVQRKLPTLHQPDQKALGGQGVKECFGAWGVQGLGV